MEYVLRFSGWRSGRFSVRDDGDVLRPKSGRLEIRPAAVILAATRPLSAAAIEETGPDILPCRIPPVQADRVTRLDFDDTVAAGN
jgi:hypothetical protein